jgi:hypothetical protein
MTEENKEIANYDEELVKRARAAKKKEKPVTGNITMKAGIIKLNGDAAPGNKLHGIIIASTHANLFYESEYDEDNPANPVCWAYGDEEETMAPHPKATKPQHDGPCVSCPQNQWGTARKGRGKACSNRRNLAIIPRCDNPDEVREAEVAVMTLPVMSCREWSKYVDRLDGMFGRPPEGVVTEVGTVPDAKSQFKVTFTYGYNVPNEILGAVFERSDKAQELLEQCWDPNPELTEEELAAKEAAAEKANKRGKRY